MPLVSPVPSVVIRVGEFVRLDLTLLDAEGFVSSVVGVPTWGSNLPLIASVTPDVSGLFANVTGVAPGDAVITCNAVGATALQATINVKVVSNYAANMTILPGIPQSL